MPKLRLLRIQCQFHLKLGCLWYRCQPHLETGCLDSGANFQLHLNSINNVEGENSSTLWIVRKSRSNVIIWWKMMKSRFFRWFSQCFLRPPANIIDTSRLQFDRVMIYQNSLILFIERGGLLAANQSAACNQVISTDRICSIKLPIIGSKGGSSWGIEGWFLSCGQLVMLGWCWQEVKVSWRSELEALLEEQTHGLLGARAYYMWACGLIEERACYMWVSISMEEASSLVASSRPIEGASSLREFAGSELASRQGNELTN